LQQKLFNLSDDLGETKDLSASHPEKVAELRGLWDKWNAEQAEALWVPVQDPAKAEGRAARKAKAKS
jgi:cob(I)alamin adenosyltransferase